MCVCARVNAFYDQLAVVSSCDCRNFYCTTLLVQAHVCHYTRVDAMEASEFDDSLQSLSTVIDDYRELERQIHEPLPSVPRLQIV